ncbi:MAG: preprotein translocase subunit SecG [Candidatus Kapabacteria bacterium]|jgi:preprotein translocase subunit SecG|nr:preprotein translocase subunit SecG [Candidatus Kapabacteria bacterium]
MFTVIVILTSLLAILLIAVVLIQPGKGDMAAGFGGVGMGLGSMFGNRRATDLLTKITIGLAASILLLSVVSNKFLTNESVEEINPVTQGVTATPSAPNPSVPNVPVQQNQQQTPPAQQKP